MTGHQPLVIVSAYLACQKTLIKKDLETLFNLGPAVIIAGDLNCKHEQWNCNTTNPNGRALINISDNLLFDILTPMTPTRYPPNRDWGTPNTLDLALLRGILVFILTTLLTYCLYLYKKIHWHFDERGVKYQPGWPVLGNVVKNTFMTRYTVEEIDRIYRAFPDEKYVVYFEGTTPVLLIRDPDIIKNITIKDFDHFVNHRQFFGEENDVLFASSLFLLKDDKWRNMRTTLSPAFTGSKMRAMMPLMIDISKKIVNYLRDKTSEDVLVDELIRRYTSDVMASAGFGLQINSLLDKDNELYMIGQTLFHFSTMQRILLFTTAWFPKLSKILLLSLYRYLIRYKLKSIEIKSIPDVRSLKNRRACMTRAMNVKEASEVFKNKPEWRSVLHWTESEMASQVFLFFIAGFESSASTLVMCIHELALNPRIEEKLYQEIKKFKEIKGDLKYDNIDELQYLDCVLNEVSRKWAVAMIMDRVCNKAYVLPPPRKGGKPYTIKPGEMVYNMVNSIHMDPKYYPEPEKFDPERFSSGNKHKIQPFTFMPFGVGPRNCIGSRFAILELKVLLYYLVLNYRITKTKKTLNPVKITPTDINVKVVGGTWVKLETRL
ncbi:hypothetical protein K1T71_007484 [Dendrolimus kikuchii]|uniref:Uncharacterized protein n=1 Tax=Dendrolimus kikuchii TaxID=765133 RepID=A0ACC1D0X2_9NEOP|nr:hypothetical protein K1T71_007484 [Dendrolimus kikuchii]